MLHENLDLVTEASNGNGIGASQLEMFLNTKNENFCGNWLIGCRDWMGHDSKLKHITKYYLILIREAML